MSHVASSKLNPNCPEVIQNIPRAPKVLQIASECYRIVEVLRRVLPNAKKCYGSPLKRLEMLEFQVFQNAPKYFEEYNNNLVVF